MFVFQITHILQNTLYENCLNENLMTWENAHAICLMQKAECK